MSSFSSPPLPSSSPSPSSTSSSSASTSSRSESLPPLDASVPFDARERLLRLGVDALNDAELIALLLSTGTSRENVAVLSQRLLSELGGLEGMTQLGFGRLASFRGIGAVKASRVAAALELGRRSQTSRPTPSTFHNSKSIFEWLAPTLGRKTHEHFVVLVLDARNRLLAEVVVAQGSLASCAFEIADAFRPVLLHGGVSAVFAHNHPSQETRPSDDDQKVTQRLLRAGDLLDIAVLDHVIVARDSYFSFLDNGLLLAPSVVSSADQNDAV